MSAVHRVVALAIPDVVAFDLSIPAQVFGHYDERDRYSFAVCAERPRRRPPPRPDSRSVCATAWRLSITPTPSWSPVFTPTSHRRTTPSTRYAESLPAGPASPPSASERSHSRRRGASRRSGCDDALAIRRRLSTIAPAGQPEPPTSSTPMRADPHQRRDIRRRRPVSTHGAPRLRCERRGRRGATDGRRRASHRRSSPVQPAPPYQPTVVWVTRWSGRSRRCGGL